MDINELYSLFLKQGSVSTDSRKCTPGAVFFALKGGNFDGNKYAAAALENGCAYAVVDDPQYAADGRYVLVDDALQTLRDLAKIHRKTLKAIIIGITGTNGKTTTKELVSAVLSKKYKTRHTIGNLNNHIGVPLTLLSFSADDEIGVVEMGANHPGEIKSSVDIVCPDYGLITNVGIAHIEGFGSFENIVKTKCELYDYIRHIDGSVFIDEDNSILMERARGIQQVTYGSTESAFAWGKVATCHPFLTFEWRQQGKLHTVETHLIGSYNLKNALAAVAVGRYFKIPAERISRAIAAYEPTNNRSQLKQTADNTLIIDAYNANPTSMKEALNNFAALPGTPKAVILGDMFELGPESDRLHEEIVRLLQQAQFDRVCLCGPHFQKVAGKVFTTYPTTEVLLEALREEPLKGYTILIKGSHSMHLEKVADRL